MWAAFWLSFVAATASFAVVAMLGRPIDAPDWLRQQIETRVEAALGNVDLRFDALEFVVNRGWRPRARMRNVVFADQTGSPIVTLSDLETSLAMRPLLKGQIRIKQIALNGGFATLRRAEDGTVSLSLGSQMARVGEAPGFAQLVKTVDSVMLRPQFTALTEISLDALTLRYEDALSGQAFTMDGGYVLLSRKQDQLRISGSASLLSGRATAAGLEFNYTSVIGETEAEFGITLTDVATQDFASQSVALSWLDVLRAPVSGALRGRIAESGALGPLSATLQIGEGVLQPVDAAHPIPFTSARTYFNFDPATALLRFDEISVASGWVSGVAEGQASLRGLGEGRLSGLVGQIRLSGLNFNPPEFYDSPIRLSEGGMDFRLSLDPFRVDLGQASLRHGESLAQFSGTLGADDQGWQVALDGRLNRITPEGLGALWPRVAIPNTRKWVVENLSGGQLRDANFALRGRAGTKPDVYFDFAYEGVDIRFMQTMPPITKASGQASLLRNRFVTTATAGQITADTGGFLDIAGTSFVIPDTTIKKGAPAIVSYKGRGAVPTVLSLLDNDPLNVMQKSGLPVDVADGQVRAEGEISLFLKPRLAPDEVTFSVKGAVTRAASGVLVQGRDLFAETLRIEGDQTGLRVSGPARLDDMPLEAIWKQPIGRPGATGTVTGRAVIGPDTLADFGIVLPPGTVSGSGYAEYTLELRGAKPRLSVSSDLAGLALRVPDLGWSHPAAATGRLEMEMTLGANPQVDRIALTASGLEAAGRIELDENGALSLARLDSVRLGGWLNAPVDLVARGPGAAPDIVINGGVLDLRTATFGDGGGTGESSASNQTLRVALDRLQITDTMALTGFRGEFGLRRGIEGAFSARLNGGTPLRGQIAPSGARSAVRITAEDGGSIFRDAGVIEQAEGGAFTLTLTPVGETGNFEGELAVTNTRVKDAPAMAALLNSLSIVGLLDELVGQGILFTDVTARFGLSPSRLTLYSGSAVGPSMGISMDGTYNTDTDTIDMQGVISPLYLINGIGALISRRGEGVIGFNYALRGPNDNPRVTVNPLSALTPGFLRGVMRSPPPQAPSTSSSGTATEPTNQEPLSSNR